MSVEYKSLGEYIRAQRGDDTQEAEAVAIGISTDTLSALELNKNKHAPSVATLNKIADYYGVSLDYLVSLRSKTQCNA